MSKRLLKIGTKVRIDTPTLPVWNGKRGVVLGYDANPDAEFPISVDVQRGEATETVDFKRTELVRIAPSGVKRAKPKVSGFTDHTNGGW